MIDGLGIGKDKPKSNSAYCVEEVSFIEDKVLRFKEPYFLYFIVAIRMCCNQKRVNNTALRKTGTSSSS